MTSFPALTDEMRERAVLEAFVADWQSVTRFNLVPSVRVLLAREAQLVKQRDEALESDGNPGHNPDTGEPKTWRDRYDDAVSTIMAAKVRASAAEALATDLRLQLDAAVEALMPFADAYRFMNGADGGVHDDTEIDDQGLLRVVNLRHAAQLTEGKS